MHSLHILEGVCFPRNYSFFLIFQETLQVGEKIEKKKTKQKVQPGSFLIRQTIYLTQPDGEDITYVNQGNQVLIRLCLFLYALLLFFKYESLH